MFNLTPNIPLGMYECPAPYKRIIGTDTFKTFLAANRLVYHKDTSIEPAQVMAKLQVLKEMDNQLEFYDAHTPNALFSVQSGAKGMSSISGNFYPEIMAWLVNNANNPALQTEVNWLQQELTKVDALIHIAYPLSAKYFLQKRGIPIRTISRALAVKLTPDQSKALDVLYDCFDYWCEKLQIQPVNVAALV